MSNTFTPGPWRVKGEHDPTRGQRIAALIDGCTFTICYAETPMPTGDPRHNMREANARLIAAAPDLYRALERLLDESADSWATEQQLSEAGLPATKIKAITIGLAALAKARGEAWPC